MAHESHTCAFSTTLFRTLLLITSILFSVCEFLLVRYVMSVCILGIAKASLREFESLHATYLGLMGPSLAAKTSFGLRMDPRPRAACFVVEPPQSVAGSEIGPPRRPPTCAFRLFPARPASFPMRNITSMPSPWLLGKFLGCSLCGNLRALATF